MAETAAEKYHEKLTEWLTEHLPDQGEVDEGVEYWSEMKPKILAMHENMKEDFCKWPASTYFHHWWQGGYAQHVFEVCKNSILLYHNNFTNGLAKFEKYEILFCAYIHDLDKMERYEYGTEPPSNAQIRLARDLGCTNPEDYTKANLSALIDHLKTGAPLHRYLFKKSEKYINVEESGHVATILAKHGIYLPLRYLEPVSLHHGTYADLIQSRGNKIQMSDLATTLHVADMMSSKMHGKYDPTLPKEKPKTEEVKSEVSEDIPSATNG